MNIHEYPENATPLELARYQVAVMEAFEKGAKIEFTKRYLIGDWNAIEYPIFDWSHCKYRVAKPKIAEGHNPNQLTEDQVDVKNGWRLLSKDEMFSESPDKSLVMFWDDRLWLKPINDGTPFISQDTYRTKQPVGYFLPKKIKPWTFETCPKGFVLIKCHDEAIFVVTKFKASGINNLTWQELIDLKFKYSLDSGSTWNECGIKE